MKVRGTQDFDKPIHAMVRTLSGDAAQAGPDASVEQFQSLMSRLASVLAGEEHDRVLDMHPLVPIAIGLHDFIRTRVMELVVHAADLARQRCSRPPTAVARRRCDDD